MYKYQTPEELLAEGFTLKCQEGESTYWTVPEGHRSGADTLYDSVKWKQSYRKTNIGYHSEIGPAVLYSSGSHIYCDNGRYHRYDGAAIYDNTYMETETREYWLHGRVIVESEYKAWLEEMGMDINNLTPEDKIIIDLKWKRDE